MNVIAIIQARMGSTRLPGKIMKKISGKTVLEHVIDRVKLSKEIRDIVIATTTKETDDPIIFEAQKLNTKYFRGSESNVLSRYYFAAKEFNADIIVRITSDCPLIDPNIIDELVSFYKKQEYDIVSNAGSDLNQRTYPRGLDTEVFSFEQLKSAFNDSMMEYQKEHVTPYIYENSKNTYFYKNSVDYSNHRWTLDTQEDFELIKQIYKHLYHGEQDFYLNDILSVFNKNPNLIKINQDVIQKTTK